MRDVLREGVLGADAAGVDARGFAGFGEGVVAAVEVFAVFELLGEVVGFGGELAVEAEEALLVGGEGLGGGALVDVLSWSEGCEGSEGRIVRWGVGGGYGGVNLRRCRPCSSGGDSWLRFCSLERVV